jgi:hypothetical protein
MYSKSMQLLNLIMYHNSIQTENLNLIRFTFLYLETPHISVLKTGPIIEPVRVLVHWFTGRTTELLVESHD